MNFFRHPSAAERYAQGRPYFQPLVAERVQRACFPDRRADVALDVGCGTGQSAVAMAEVALRVIAMDASIAMLDQAEAHARVTYVASMAEALPFESHSFDLLAVGLALHWFDQRDFLQEARRVLRPGGWLVVFNDSFSGQMNENPAYGRWNAERYARRFPAPPRHATLLSGDAARVHGFTAAGQERFTHTVAFTPDQLVRYLLTHSNVIAAAEEGSDDIGSIATWLSDGVRPQFRGAIGTFPFRCALDIFRRQGDS